MVVKEENEKIDFDDVNFWKIKYYMYKEVAWTSIW